MIIRRTGLVYVEMFIAVLIGIGLSASAGFRVFTPLLITSLATKTSWVTLATGFDWIGSTPALIAFSIATVIEICTYYIPFVDNIMKMIATPAAVIAGTLLTASFIGEMEPFLTWSIAIIAGGGVASVAQVTTTSIRGASTVTTGGFGNFIVSIGEGIMAIVMSILAIVMPFLVIIFIGILLFLFIRVIKWLRGRKEKNPVLVN